MVIQYEPKITDFPMEVLSDLRDYWEMPMIKLQAVKGDVNLAINGTGFPIYGTDVLVDYLYFCIFIMRILQREDVQIPLLQENFPLMHAWVDKDDVVLFTRFGTRSEFVNGRENHLGSVTKEDLRQCLQSTIGFENEISKYSEEVGNCIREYRLKHCAGEMPRL